MTAPGRACVAGRFETILQFGGHPMRSVLLWLVGIPIPIIILIALFVR